jgi:solute carrier family 13 (sodium-dependent dicarboxylate transporter), member 2/3/5
VGLFLFAAVLLAPTPPEMSPLAQKTAATAILMACWWIGEALPIPCTALLPLVLFPLFGVLAAGDVSKNYGNPNIFLFMGGLFMAMSMQRWSLHRRIALAVLTRVPRRPSAIVAGFMLATAGISMWISDTATVMLMMPIGVAVIMQVEGLTTEDEPRPSPFGSALMLGIAYAGVIGGIGTLVGTPPNLVFAGTYQELVPDGQQIGFARWMMVGTTVTVIMLPITWLYLTRVAFNLNANKADGEILDLGILQSEKDKLGEMRSGEKITLAVFLSAAGLWLTRGEYHGGEMVSPGWAGLFDKPEMVSDSTVSVAAALLLFVLRTTNPDGEGEGPVLDWEWARKIPWRVLLLFGGGFALADAFQVSGLSQWVGSRITFLSSLPPIAMIAVVCFVMTFMTEVTSNTATTTVLMPVLATAASTMGLDPLLLMMPAAMSASCAFMLPVATPGNAIVFGSGFISLKQMARTGLGLNLIGCVVITIVIAVVAVPVFHLSLTAVQ